MKLWLQLAVCFLALTASAQEAKRSYVFTGIVPRDDCNLLPQRSFEIRPSLNRSQTNDRLAIQCGEAMDGTTLLSMTFFLTDTPPQLQPGQSRRYSFRWGAKVGPSVRMTGEFGADEEKCRKTLAFFLHAAPQDPKLSPVWEGGCYGDDRFGTSLEITLTEFTRQ